ncbi:thiol:disulfide oxidoreductase [Hylemonella gracilis str. Niagara R]|uniref:Thiol:disulfide oxidoreductase n=1 Tax=Hylemonella gracilis str. Niagara R TaxID=1458275 RepID=A0A016XIF9_9BURK|nr:TlpA disulfide reductase family protein [Hylemonella gracilis]EYC51680.1 thiol:disulfide oxidoreductase [Hylemonella gracilis str. Niagara R]
MMQRRLCLRAALGAGLAPLALAPVLRVSSVNATAAITAGQALTPWPPGQKAPPLRALDLQGRAWTLEALRGRVVLLNFWASWCAPCRVEMPTLQTLAAFYGDAVRVLVINVGEGPRAITRFLQSSALDTDALTVLLDTEKEAARAWDAASVLPTTVLIDAQGQPRHRVRGELDWSGEQAQALVEALLP